MSEELRPADALRGAGLRVTGPRLAVLETLDSASDHPDAEKLTATVRARLGSVSHQTIYDVLRALSEADLIRRIDPPDSLAARYEIHRHDNHHHLMCRRCHTLVDVACAEEDSPCLNPEDAHGFVLDEAEIVFRGLCPACQEKNT